MSGHTCQQISDLEEIIYFNIWTSLLNDLLISLPLVLILRASEFTSYILSLSVKSFYCLRMVPEFLSLSLSATVTWFTSTATILTTNIATITFNSATWWSVFPTLLKWNILILFLQVNLSFGSLNSYLFPLSIHMRWGRRNQWKKGERERD